jgi:hypothetical protein
MGKLLRTPYEQLLAPSEQLLAPSEWVTVFLFSWVLFRGLLRLCYSLPFIRNLLLSSLLACFYVVIYKEHSLLVFIRGLSFNRHDVQLFVYFWSNCRTAQFLCSNTGPLAN